MEKLVYTEPECLKFFGYMKNAGFSPYHYIGRNFWEGPAVTVRDIQDALSNTKVKCQWDNIGKQFIVYPVKRDKGK